MIKEMFNFLNSYAAGLTIIVSLLAAVYKFAQYVNIRRKEQTQKEFENYHSLIKNLSQPDTPGVPIKLDRQVAVVYELRAFPKYKDVTIRILQHWLALREKDPNNEACAVLYKEMHLTVDYLKDNFVKRWFVRTF